MINCLSDDNKWIFVTKCDVYDNDGKKDQVMMRVMKILQ